MTKAYLIRCARQEIQEWEKIPPGIIIAILWAFIERAVNGEPIEKTYKLFAPKPKPMPDYEI